MPRGGGSGKRPIYRERLKRSKKKILRKAGLLAGNIHHPNIKQLAKDKAVLPAVTAANKEADKEVTPMFSIRSKSVV